MRPVSPDPDPPPVLTITFPPVAFAEPPVASALPPVPFPPVADEFAPARDFERELDNEERFADDSELDEELLFAGLSVFTTRLSWPLGKSGLPANAVAESVVDIAIAIIEFFTFFPCGNVPRLSSVDRICGGFDVYISPDGPKLRFGPPVNSGVSRQSTRMAFRPRP